MGIERQFIDRDDPAYIGEAIVPIALQGRRMFLHTEIASGTAEGNRTFSVSYVLDAVRLLISIDGRRYTVPLDNVIGETLDLDAERERLSHADNG